MFVEGILVVDKLDIFAAAPGGNVPRVVTVSTFVTDGTVTIDLVRNKDNPQINGIEVFDDGAPVPAPVAVPPMTAPVASPPNTAPVAPFQDIVINCGGTFDFRVRMFDAWIPHSLSYSPISQCVFIFVIGPLYLEQSGLRQWSADTYFNGGSTYSISNIAVADTVDDLIYQSERVGTFSYSIPVPLGTYEIIIHLAELYVKLFRCQ